MQLWLNSDNVVLGSGSNIEQLTDLSGNNNHAIQLDNSKQAQQVLNTLNGLPVISFDGTNDYFQLNEINNAMTFFFIINENSSAGNDYRPLLGHSTLYDFHRGDNKILWDNLNTNSFIRSGITKINSQQINGTTSTVPNNFSFLSIATTGSVSFDNISIDRFVPTRVWYGQIAEIIVYNRSLSTTEYENIELFLYNKYAPPVSLGADINQAYSFCPITIDAGNNFTSYTWSTGASTSSISVTTSGTYSVTVTDIFGRNSSDEIVVNFPSLVIKNDTTVCYNTEYRWNTFLNTTDFDFAWSNSDTDSLTFFNPTTATTLNCTITDLFACSYTTPTITIAIDDFSQTASLGSDVSLCEGNTIGLITSSLVTSYNWMPGNLTTPLITITNSGTYTVEAFNSIGCEVNDEIVVTIAGSVPTADFVFNTTCFGSDMQFSSLAVPPSGNSIVSYTWSFGEPSSGVNNSSLLEHPLHNYLTDGNFDVFFEVETEIGCKQSITKQVTVYPLPVVDFLSLPACANSLTQFKDLSDGLGQTISIWDWNFGDVTSPSNTAAVAEPFHEFNSESTYLVSLTVTTQNGCKAGISKPVYVYPSPIVDFVYTNPCFGSVITYTNTSTMPFPQTIQSWTWNFGDAQSATSPIEYHSYASAGIYDVSLFINSSVGCTHSVTKTINVTPYPTANYSYTNYCLNEQTTFVDASSAPLSTIESYKWEFDSNVFSTTDAASYVFNSIGNKNVKLTVSNVNGCENSVTKTILIKSLPIASFSYSPSFVTPGESVLFTNLSQNATSYTWVFGNGFSSNLFKPTTIFPDSLRYVVSLVAKDEVGCNNSFEKEIEVLFPKLDLGIFTLKAEVSNDNFLDISTDLINYGTKPITDFKLLSSVNSESSVRESWTGDLKRGQLLPYVFTSSVKLDASDTVNAYVCVKIVEVNELNTDDDITNNERCISFRMDRFMVLAGYPNPTETNFTLPVILPEDGEIIVEVYNDLGQLVFDKYVVTAVKGLKSITLDIDYLERGVYFYRVSFKDKVARNKFMITK
ncbi:MAG: PKD domain-containing protein [Bacteroidota bacterium]